MNCKPTTLDIFWQWLRAALIALTLALLMLAPSDFLAPRVTHAAPPSQTSRTFTVPPGKYVSTGIQLKKGQKFTINASGTVKVPTAFPDSTATEWGPGGFCHDPIKYGCLMFGLRIKVGQGTSEFYVRNGEFTASVDGELVLYVGEHDYERPGNGSGMSGAFSVTVTLPGLPPPQVQPQPQTQPQPVPTSPSSAGASAGTTTPSRTPTQPPPPPSVTPIPPTIASSVTSVPTLVALNPIPTTSSVGMQGDCGGDDKISEVDALCALEMSTQVRLAKQIMDMDNSGDVTSRDAVIILQRAIGK